MCHLRTEKEKLYAFWEHFNQTLNKYIPAENKIKENKTPKTSMMFAEHKTNIFTPKCGKFSGEYGRYNPRLPI